MHIKNTRYFLQKNNILKLYEYPFSENSILLIDFYSKGNKKMTDFEKITYFFECDKNIKNLMQEMCPDANYAHDKNQMSKHADKMYENFKDIKKMMQRLNEEFNFGSKIDEKLADIEKQIVEVRPDYESLLRTYNRFIADMNENLVKKANENICGFLVIKDVQPLYSMSNTINEILHIMHKEIENNDELFEKLPVVEKIDGQYFPLIACYGKDTTLARKVYNNLSVLTGYGVNRTDIVQVISISDDHCMALIRNIGHALMLDIKENTLENNEKSYSINYFIPKICNKKMAEKNLVGFGIRKIKEDEKFATGVFEANEMTFGIRTLLFVSNVPTDDNIPKPYETEEEKITAVTIPELLNNLTAEELTRFGNTNKEFANQYKDFASILKDKISQRQNEMKIEDLAKGMELINSLEDITSSINKEIETQSHEDI